MYLQPFLSLDQERSKRCFLLCAYESAASISPEVHLGGGASDTSSHASLLVWLLPHFCSETSGCPVTQTWPKVDYLSGQYHFVQSDTGGCIERQRLNPLVTSTPLICNELEEISFNPFTLLRVPRLCDKFPRNEIIIAKGKNSSSLAET